jgi:hypothetical protein
MIRDRESTVRLTLHEAIVAVLADELEGLPAKTIAQRIAERDLYRRKVDGQRPPEKQVGWRIHKYPELFSVDRTIKPQRVKLKRGRTR